ncbi:MAG: DUF2846 domain-containing protein [Nitrospirota bacterium]|nr:DUF2846 domain-containing protein [Nitrospirota bacterium]
MRRFLLIALLAVTLLQGCARLPAPEEMAQEIKGFELPAKPDQNSAMIYVVRPSMVGTLVRFNVFLDNHDDASEMGYNRGSQYIFFTVKPGRHDIFSKAENWADATIDAKGGDTIFIRQDVQMGFIMARNSLTVVDVLEGTYHVKNTQAGTMIKTQN